MVFVFFNKNQDPLIKEEIEVYDVNSMGPAMMLKPLPIERPYYYRGKIETNRTFSLGIQRFYVNSAELKPNKIPMLNNNTPLLRGGVEYLTHVSEHEMDEKKTFMLTLPEFELFKESYHYEKLECLDGYVFKAKDCFFNEYINEFLKIKNSDDKTIKRIGKMFLNTLSGKFGENPRRYECFIEFENDLQRFYRKDEPFYRKCGYLPIAIFMNSYARVFLIESIYKIGVENFIYCDTDSIHCLKTENAQKLNIHPSKIGAWKLENSDKKLSQLNIYLVDDIV
ncbi:DNA polymerase [Bartonella massiliensis]|uniref:DNA polymerase n=1 Tax=Bartonella massiliensis TaxID=929795 RepID=UPI001159F999|nr:DNA polymerase [Bartonella massiliensis]